MTGHLADDLLVLAKDADDRDLPDEIQLPLREVGEVEGADGLLSLDDGLDAEHQVGREEHVSIPVDPVQAVKVQFGVERSVELGLPILDLEAVVGDLLARLIVDGEGNAACEHGSALRLTDAEFLAERLGDPLVFEELWVLQFVGERHLLLDRLGGLDDGLGEQLLRLLPLQALHLHRQLEEVAALAALRAVPEVLLVAVGLHDGVGLAPVGTGEGHVGTLGLVADAHDLEGRGRLDGVQSLTVVHGDPPCCEGLFGE